MADALPPETPQVQVEKLKSFTRDLELSVRTKAKGYGARAVSTEELRRWIDAALESATDDAIRPKESSASAGTPYFVPSARTKLFTGLKERVAARIAELESGQVTPTVSTRDWVVDQTLELAKASAQVLDAKSGAVAPADPAELERWLKTPPVTARKKD